jgi:hypothetical protein
LFCLTTCPAQANQCDPQIKTRTEYYVRRQWERSLKQGDRVAVLGHGIAVVEQTDDKEALVVLGTRDVLRIAGKDIVWNQQNMRWECEAKMLHNRVNGVNGDLTPTAGLEFGTTSDC